MVCVVDSNPPTRLSWTWRSLTLNPSHPSNTGVLELSGVHVGDEGEFTCRAQHPWESLHVSLHLSLQSEGTGGWERGWRRTAPPPSQSTQRPPELQRGAQLCLCSAVRPGIGLGLRASPVVFLPGLCGVGEGLGERSTGKEVRPGREGLGPGQLCVGDTGSLLCGAQMRVRQMRRSSWVHTFRRSQRSLSNQEKEYHNTVFILNKKAK